MIGMELFARALKNASTIHGINVGPKEIKITQYADDTTVFVRDREPITHFVLRYWQDYKLLMPGNRIPPEHEIIWNNQNILVDKKTFILQKLVSA